MISPRLRYLGQKLLGPPFLPSLPLLWEFKLWNQLDLSLRLNSAISSCVALRKLLNFSDSLPIKSGTIYLVHFSFIFFTVLGKETRQISPYSQA